MNGSWLGQIIGVIGDGLWNAVLMAWQVWWALVLGFAISAVVQAWVSPERIKRSLGGRGAKPVARATVLGMASSSCSYAAIAIAKSLFQKGASAASALAFQFASTNLVVELGVVMWLLIGWQFALADFIGGLVLVVIMSLLLRLFISRKLEQQAREHAVAASTGHQHAIAADEMPWRQRLTSARAWSNVAHNFRNDWLMVYKEIGIGFVLAGFIGLLGNDFFNALFIADAPAPLRIVENAVVGPLIAVLSFVCSIGNVPVAAVLWSGGISFGGVIAFIFADLIVVPIVLIYRKYYGRAFAMRATALMFVTMVISALIVDGLFSVAGLVPSIRPSRADLFGSLQIDYKFWLNVLGLLVFAGLFWLTVRRGARDPVCGMRVDRDKAVVVRRGARRYYFCSEHCAHEFEQRGLGGERSHDTHSRHEHS